jgi:hypothetical protein
MSRAGDLIGRLDRFNYGPSVNEQEPEMDNDDGGDEEMDDGGDTKEGEDEEEPDPRTQAEPNSPFSKDTRNPDGSMKTETEDEPIDDKKSKAASLVQKMRR